MLHIKIANKSIKHFSGLPRLHNRKYITSYSLKLQLLNYKFNFNSVLTIGYFITAKSIGFSATVKTRFPPFFIMHFL